MAWCGFFFCQLLGSAVLLIFAPVVWWSTFVNILNIPLVVLAFIVAAVITPPDVVSQLSLALPMCLLYELGIWSALLFIKHTKAPDADDEAEGKGKSEVSRP